MAEYLVPRIRQVPEKSRALLGEGVGSSQVGRLSRSWPGPAVLCGRRWVLAGKPVAALRRAAHLEALASSGFCLGLALPRTLTCSTSRLSVRFAVLSVPPPCTIRAPFPSGLPLNCSTFGTSLRPRPTPRSSHASLPASARTVSLRRSDSKRERGTPQVNAPPEKKRWRRGTSHLLPSGGIAATPVYMRTAAGLLPGPYAISLPVTASDLQLPGTFHPTSPLQLPKLPPLHCDAVSLLKRLNCAEQSGA